jgi:hypothetical protein
MRALAIVLLLSAGCFGHYITTADTLRDAEAVNAPRGQVAIGALKLPVGRQGVFVRADRVVRATKATTGSIELRGFNRWLSIGSVLLLAAVGWGAAALSVGLVNAGCMIDCGDDHVGLSAGLGAIAGAHVVAGLVLTLWGSERPSQEVPAGRPGVIYVPLQTGAR